MNLQGMAVLLLLGALQLPCRAASAQVDVTGAPRQSNVDARQAAGEAPKPDIVYMRAGRPIWCGQPLAVPPNESFPENAFAICKRMPDDPRKSIVALASAHQETAPAEGVIDYDLDILVIESNSGKLFGQLRKKKAISSDAWRLSGIAIDTGLYQLSSKVRAFGLRISHESSSHVSWAGDTTLNLYVEAESGVHEVLGGLIVQRSGGEQDSDCDFDGATSETQRTVTLGNASSHGLVDLIVKSVTSTTANKKISGQCREVRSKPEVTHSTLHFNGKIYAIPAALL